MSACEAQVDVSMTCHIYIYILDLDVLGEAGLGWGPNETQVQGIGYKII